MMGPVNGMSKLTLLAKQNTYQPYLIPVRSVYETAVGQCLEPFFWVVSGIRHDPLIHPLQNQCHFSRIRY